AHGATSDSNRVVIRGDYATSPGTIAFSASGWLDAVRKYTTFKSITITSTAEGYNCIYASGSAGIVVDGCTLTGGNAGVVLPGTVAFTSATIKNCIMTGQTTAGIAQSVTAASLVSSGITVTGNTIHDTSLYGIYFAITSTNSAWTSSTFVNYLIANNTVYNTPSSSIYARACHNDFVTAPTVYSPGLVMSGNTVYNCGTIAGPSGDHGGLLVSGFVSPVITNNIVRDTYVTGAGLQTSKNKYPLITFNTITGIRAGTEAAAFQNGFPIDGCGIFFDNLTIGGLAYGNYISDLISTGIPNSGTGLTFWNCSGSKFIGNIVENCFTGASYGKSSETDNHLLNNTFINCSYGVSKIGTDALTGNVTVKNNLLHNCSAGFSIGANPSITADYNNVYGSMNPYVGISAGANDLNVHPLLDADYRPQAAALKRAGTSPSGKDFYGKQFYNPPNIGAVNDLPATPRYLLTSPKNPDSGIR
ncbi:MAG TPA: right-handed parallel beta-helix repeat-containing protein, partial [Nitrosospira sp.]|nr:right-handed parallel beta-helix repeat-containing protein [Nitrosospira sp.]